MRHSNLVKTKERKIRLCDQPYHTNKQKYRKGERLKFCGTVNCPSYVLTRVTDNHR